MSDPIDQYLKKLGVETLLASAERRVEYHNLFCMPGLCTGTFTAMQRNHTPMSGPCGCPCHEEQTNVE